jgi:23S rRNA pseudouridine955/2504/2580 synthase
MVESAVRHVTIDGARAGQRLDNFLLGQLGDLPRSAVYRIIRTGQVRVNGRRARPMQKLSAGDEVRVPPVRQSPDQPVRVPDGLRQAVEEAIIYQDGQMAVIDKPAGLAMHGGSGLRFGLMNVLAEAHPEWRPVHRLDRATSGLVVLACDYASAVALQQSFVSHDIEKRYLALLTGRLPEDQVVVDAPLKKIQDGSGQRRVVVDPEGQSAHSAFKVLERLPGYTYVEVTIATGRTHQIRAHAAHLGLPLAGDERYNPNPPPAGLQRLFLHAHHLRLPAFNDQLFSSPLPEALREVLDRLRDGSHDGGAA